MKKTILTLAMGLLVVLAGAQTLRVSDHETGEPIEKATLMSASPRAFTTTNAQGLADITAFQGAERIEIRVLGYRTEFKSFAELKAAGFELRMVLSTINLDDVVIAATRWKQTSNNVPSKIVSVPEMEVILQNPQTAADLLNVSGNVFIQKSQQGGGSPMIRGFATNRLLYSVDGVRMNTAIFRGGNLQNVISLDPFAIENTEVLFGPGSVIYGSDAIGGVMSFQTLTPLFSLGDKPVVSGKAVSRHAMANNEMTGHIDLNVGWKKFSMLTSVSAYDFDDLRMGSHGPEEYLRPFFVQRVDSMDVVVTNDDPEVQRPSGYSQVNIMQKFRYQPNANWDIQYGFHYSETSDYARYDRHIRYKNGLPRYGEWSYGPQKWMMNNLQVTHTGDKAAYDEVSLRLAQQYFEESRIDRAFNKDTRSIRTEKVDAYSLNLDLSKQAGERNHLYYGIEGIWDLVRSSGIDEDISTGGSVTGPSRYPQATWASYGIYVSDQYRASERLLAQAGLRYNRFVIDAEFDTTFYPFPFTTAQLNKGALTGSLGFVYRPSGKWVISLNLATAFRSPNVDDLGKVFDSEQGSVTVPNPDLEAEYAYNADLSLARVFGENVKADLTGYYTLLDKALVRRDFTLNGLDSILYDGVLSQVQAMQNAARARVYGIQAGVEAKLPAGFGFSTDLNFQKGVEELDDGSTSPSRHAPPWFGSSRLSYHVTNLNLQLYAVYSGGYTYDQLPVEERGKPEIYAVDMDGNPYSPGWYTLNFKAMYHFADHLTLSAGLENITDQRYRPYSSGISGAGRNFILAVRYDF